MLYLHQIELELNMALKSWDVSDEFWNRVAPLIPKAKRDPEKNYQRRRGAGRKSMESRKIFEAIGYVIRTGIQRKTLPEKYGSSSSVHRCFQKWETAGFFVNSGKKGLLSTMRWKGLPGNGKVLTEQRLRLQPRGNQQDLITLIGEKIGLNVIFLSTCMEPRCQAS